MDWLNYHHLYYFWIVAREGSIVRATHKLQVAQPTISGQLRELERALGEKLFSRVGRGLVLTETGQVVLQYADEIFTLGRELLQTLRGQSSTERQVRVVIGVADVVPKLVAKSLIDAVFDVPEEVQVSCIEGPPGELLSELAQHQLDVVITDQAIPPSIRVRAYNHLLGETGVTVFGTRTLREAYRRSFPESLDGAPFLLPSRTAAVRREIDGWFDSIGIRPVVRGEFDDSALLKVIGQAGRGLFFAPTTLERDVRTRYGVHAVGRVDEVRERFYAISVERRFKNPAVVAIAERAKSLFLEGPGGA